MMAYISTLKKQNIDINNYSYMTCLSNKNFQHVINAIKENDFSNVICTFEDSEIGDNKAILLARSIQQEFQDGISLSIDRVDDNAITEIRIALKDKSKSISERAKAAREEIQLDRKFQDKSLTLER